jgi:hypothetical protein
VLGASLALWSIGDVYYYFYAVNLASPPVVSLSDVPYWGFYLLAAVGIALLVRSRTSAPTLAQWLDAGLCALATAAVASAVIIEAVLGQIEGGLSGAHSRRSPTRSPTRCSCR